MLILTDIIRATISKLTITTSLKINKSGKWVNCKRQAGMAFIETND